MNPDHGDADLLHRVDEVTGALEQLSTALTEDEELPVLLHRVCQQVVHAVPDGSMASISLTNGDAPWTAARTDDRADEIDKAQYAADQGPCLESARTRTIMRVTVAEAAQRWPEFADAAGEAAVGSYLSAPLFIDEIYQGSLNIYGEDTHGFGALDAALVELYTTAAEAGLRAARRYQASRETVAQLRTALTSRAVIDQAKGIIMAVRRISADEAFTVLVEQSQVQNIKLRDLAERFIADLLTDNL